MYTLAPVYYPYPLGDDPSSTGGSGAPPVATPTTPTTTPTTTPIAASEPVSDLASTMVLRGAVGVLAGAACAPRGSEAIWAAAGFVAGATLGEVGIVGLLAAALWRKAGV